MNATIFIIAHAPLAQALKSCAMHVYPECADDVMVLDVLPLESPEKTLLDAQKKTQHLLMDQVLVLTDMLGATPSNVAQKLVNQTSAKLIAGVNLPMLLRTVCYRHESLDALVQRALTGGTQGVLQIAQTQPSLQVIQKNAHTNNHHQQ